MYIRGEVRTLDSFDHTMFATRYGLSNAWRHLRCSISIRKSDTELKGRHSKPFILNVLASSSSMYHLVHACHWALHFSLDSVRPAQRSVHMSKSMSGTVWSGGANRSRSSGELSLPSRSQGWCSVSSELSLSPGSLLSRDRMRHLAFGDRLSGVTNWPLLILRKREACSLSLKGYLQTEKGRGDYK